MKSYSQKTRSDQNRQNIKLNYCLKKNLQKNFTPRINSSTTKLCDQIQYFKNQQIPIILDNGCGNGFSSLWLANKNPQAIVFGVDRAKRFVSNKLHPNLIFARAELAQLWKLLWEQEIEISKSFLLYPNPWPKSKHLRRRWHAHPAFKYLTWITKYLEIRTNWKIYGEEAYSTLKLVTNNETTFKEFLPIFPISLHEKKYTVSGHSLFKLVSKNNSGAKANSHSGLTLIDHLKMIRGNLS